MPRLSRIQPVGLPLHITQRGNTRAACFFDEADYLAYLHRGGRGNPLNLSHPPSQVVDL